MPVKPENRKRYPAPREWRRIRARILERAGDRCEKCKAPNRQLVARGAKGSPDESTYMLERGDVHSADDGRHLGVARGSEYSFGRMVRIVLTIAHLDHQPENNSDDNLRAYCQRCHLLHDVDHHKATAAATRHARRAVADLFDTLKG